MEEEAGREEEGVCVCIGGRGWGGEVNTGGKGRVGFTTYSCVSLYCAKWHLQTVRGGRV
jgi:hypothetical protein